MKRGVGDSRTKVEKERKLERSIPYGLLQSSLQVGQRHVAITRPKLRDVSVFLLSLFTVFICVCVIYLTIISVAQNVALRVQ